MNFEKFEHKGLKIDRDRVLTYSQLSCPLDCKYCFVEDMNFNQAKDVAYLSEEQFDLLNKLPEDIKIIMLGCDTEFFQSKEDSLKTLDRLTKLNKDISVVTKLALSSEFIQVLKSVDQKLHQHSNFLAFSVSLTCIDSAKQREPRAPKPRKRIETLKLAFEADIKTLVALRPLLPSVSIGELEKIVSLTKDYCYGYYSGPLYLKNLDFLSKEEQGDLKIEKLQPHWMPKDNMFYKVEKEGQMEMLREIIVKNGKMLFEGAAEGITYLRKHEKY